MTDPHSPSMRERSRVDYPAWTWVRARPARLLAFGLGSGLIRPASGTWGTLAAWILWLLLPSIPDLAMGIALLLAFAYGCWACGQAGRELGVHDHVGMVWDEMVAFWLVLWLVPGGWLAQSLAFLLFRFFDIVKPPPIKAFDARLSGGFGVMWDDIVAAAYTLLVMALAVRLGVLA
ncbi:phosphatidylglycerophosphatase A [Bordetella hinzii CA90 BAL1384]|nr:Phosphatidylglycerophosphatase A [Bordetella hinzii]KCB26755.1 phosphatidylglycerophosphatase A [Bordetella hinzii L60]KCB29622.1 phosphatidylglycerophosphatase A [Bordetella hinzii CA90 BAL1384]KCB51850.1 phosphatidylglycerophosphatase A [Bordetella hinzii 1277]